MAWAPEMEVLDQLLVGDMSLFVIGQVLHRGDPDKRCHSASRMLQDGVVELFDAEHNPVAAWQWRALLSDESSWGRDTGYYFKLTNKGAKYIG